MLRVPLQELRRGLVDTAQVLEAHDPLFAKLDFELDGPVRVEGRLQSTADGDVLWRATISGQARASCRRCLADVPVPLAIEIDALFTSDPDAWDDPAVYPMPERATHLDVSDAVREEVALTVPAFGLCREDCAGLCQKCGIDLNAGACECAASARHQ
jgi:uncharacterized protein